MTGLEDIAATGAPATVAALGMGTVFTCLTILYLLTRLMGNVMPRLLRPPQKAEPIQSSASAGESDERPDPVADETPGTGREGIVAAITIALARHRSARLTPRPRAPQGIDGWKMAGRVRGLRKR
jgi:sodium pump decarboxylase gamma subunit